MSAKNVDAAPLGSRPASRKDEEEVEMEDADHEEVDKTSAKRSKKKRRVIKITDKKYECPQADCGKSYSRAEHLYRHQLNHTPKQIYHCDFPGCDRNFVRADLCARHKERHTAKGSHLQRKDAFMNSQRQQQSQQQLSNVAGSNAANDSATSGPSNNISSSPVDSAHPAQQSTTKQEPNAYRPQTAQQPQTPYTTVGGEREYPQHSQQIQQLPPVQASTVNCVNPQLAAGGSYSAFPTSFNDGATQVFPSPSSTNNRRYSMDNQYNRPSSMTSGYTQPLPMHPPPVPGQQPLGAMYTQSPYQPQGANQQGETLAPNEPASSMPSLPPFGMPPPAYSDRSSAMSPPAVGPEYATHMNTAAPIAMYPELDAFGHFTGQYSMPVFGTDGFNRSPQSGFDELLFAGLLDGSNMNVDVPSPPPDLPYHMHMAGMAMPKLEPVGTTSEQLPPITTVDDKSPEIYAMDLSMRESKVSEKRQQRLINMVNSWEDIERMPGRRIKEEILSGDITDPKHPLSVEMLKTYLTSFWIHIHQQMPIMHRPSFNADTCPDLLLLAMMCLGACCLDRTHPPDHIKLCAELSFFAAYHIRWEVFKDAEFRPTAKLWTFQTMLLLELFEKMYSTRVLHERAHVHHATTLTVMRRGSSLIGRGANDEALSDPTRTPPGPDGSINTSGQNTGDAWWNRWITNEATRRVAFAAFIIDSTHATLFGHSASMTLADLKMHLPCDEHLWAAESGAEVQRIEQSLASYGLQRVNFIDGMKKTLAGEKVRTNVFGRVVLMAGLLSFSWHMNQRDETSSALRQNTVGGPEKWRRNVTHAFDHWRRDFDEHLVKSEGEVTPAEQSVNKSTCHKDHRDNVFESRTCLHSLAHMAMHASIVDCEIFAGSGRVLGRVVLDTDRASTSKKMQEWAHTAKARHAVYHALRFLREVLLPDTEAMIMPGQKQQLAQFTYSARDDYLLNRPYIMYFACMIVWAYGYALEGPIVAPKYSLLTRDAQIWDMQQYLRQFSNVGLDDLANMSGRNNAVGLLILMRDCFEKPRWELLHESATMLGKCVEMLWPGLNDELKSFREQEEQQKQQQQQQQIAYGTGMHRTGKMA
ncbi:hypothetical protein Slin15195_G077560 [Septoria linicola]|uniref:C2H2-type domain-containing protein n=1 Tax=Septoria linicola TaxID=215465 RepID=A0A9Q9ELI7_9PEZI|nr:hypothetical protein Slin15195_G077560 [Septoria linicola]